MAHNHPNPINRAQAFREQKRGRYQEDAKDYRPKSNAFPSDEERPHSNGSKDAADQKPKVALLFCFTLHARFLSLHSSSCLNITIRRSAHHLCLKVDAGGCILSSSLS